MIILINSLENLDYPDNFSPYRVLSKMYHRYSNVKTCAAIESLNIQGGTYYIHYML